MRRRCLQIASSTYSEPHAGSTACGSCREKGDAADDAPDGMVVRVKHAQDEVPQLRRPPPSGPVQQPHRHHESQIALATAYGLPLSQPVEVEANEPYASGGGGATGLEGAALGVAAG